VDLPSPWPLRSIQEQDFVALLELFMEHRPKYEDPYEADGHCAVAADEFRHLVRQLALPLNVRDIQFVPDDEADEERRKVADASISMPPPSFRILGYCDPEHSWYANGCKWGGHVAIVINNKICVDFTARQFSPKAPWPLVYPLPEVFNTYQPKAA
jgi:hypothetical protein